MGTDKSPMLRFPLDKAGYLNALLLQSEIRQLLHNPFHRKEVLLREALGHKNLVSLTKAISNGAITFDQLLFYDNGEIEVYFPLPSAPLNITVEDLAALIHPPEEV